MALRIGLVCVAFVLPSALHGQPVPGLLVERAIKVAGGAPALHYTSRIAWEGDAVVYAGGRTVSITGSWQVSLPDSAIVITRPVGTDSTAMRTLSVSGNTGFLAGATGMERMPAAMLASERDEFWGYHLMRLVTLRDTTFTLRLIPGDSVEWKGIEVRAPGRPTAQLQFDERARLRSIVMDVRDPAGQGTHRQQFLLAGEQRIATPDGMARWFERLEIVQDGVPYFALTTRNVRLAPPVTPP